MNPGLSCTFFWAACLSILFVSSAIRYRSADHCSNTGDAEISTTGICRTNEYNSIRTLEDVESFSDTERDWLRNLRPHTVNTGAPVKRKEIKSLTKEERTLAFRAIRDMQFDKADTAKFRSKVVTFATLHRNCQKEGDAPLFFTWHRELLFRFEKALQEYDSSIAVPYWDATADAYLPSPKDSVVWSPAFFGTGNGTVDDGPFAYTKAFSCTWLSRAVGEDKTGDLYEDVDFLGLIYQTTFDKTISNARCFEDMHGPMHNYVGGSMGTNNNCPDPELDPVFWMFHAYIDYIFQQFRSYTQTGNVEMEWLDMTDPACEDGDRFDDLLDCFEPVSQNETVSTFYESYSVYEERPYACTTDTDCGNDYTWCSSTYGRCLSKVVDGGDCTGLPHSACMSGNCLDKNECDVTSDDDVADDDTEDTGLKAELQKSISSSNSLASSPIKSFNPSAGDMPPGDMKETFSNNQGDVDIPMDETVDIKNNDVEDNNGVEDVEDKAVEDNNAEKQEENESSSSSSGVSSSIKALINSILG